MIKKHLSIALFILYATLVSFYLGCLEVRNNTNTKIIESYSDSIKVLNKDYLLLKNQQIVLKDSLNEVLYRFKTIRKSVIILKQESNEKADSVYNLSNNESLLFLTEWLSKRDSIK